MINVTRSIESYDSVFGIKQSVTLTGNNKPFDNELSTSESVRILRDWNNQRIEEISMDDNYAISTEGLKNIFDKLIYIITRIIGAITDVIRKILGKKTKKEIINRLKESCNKMREDQRAEFVREVQEKLKLFSDWFPNVDKPVFPDLYSYDVSYLKTVMSEISKINSQFIKLSEGIGLGPRATHERVTDTKNMTRLLENFEKNFLNKFNVSKTELNDNKLYIKKRRSYIIQIMKLKPKVYAPNSKNSGSTFSIVTDFVEKKDKFANDVNNAFLNPLKSALTATEHSVKKIKSYLDKAYGEKGYKELTILSSTYTKITSSIQSLYVFPLTLMCSELTLASLGITGKKEHHDETTTRVGGAYEQDIKFHSKRLF